MGPGDHKKWSFKLLKVTLDVGEDSCALWGHQVRSLRCELDKEAIDSAADIFEGCGAETHGFTP